MSLSVKCHGSGKLLGSGMNQLEFLITLYGSKFANNATVITSDYKFKRLSGIIYVV